MRSLPIEPLIGVANIKLGGHRHSVHALLGMPEESFKRTPSNIHHTDAWDENALQVSYDESAAQPMVQFIECYRPHAGVMLYGLPVFATGANTLIAHAAKQSGYEPKTYEAGCLLVFHDLELGFWRPARSDRTFSTVSIGHKSYYAFLLA